MYINRCDGVTTHFKLFDGECIAMWHEVGRVNAYVNERNHNRYRNYGIAQIFAQKGRKVHVGFEIETQIN
jgi:hypothetical protein